MKYRFYYGNGVDAIPVSDKRLSSLHDEMGEQIIQKAREFIAEGNPNQFSGQEFRDVKTGLTFTTFALVYDPDKAEAGEEDIIVLMSEEAYRTFLKLCELMGWDEVQNEKDDE